MALVELAEVSGKRSSRKAWSNIWGQYLHFRGDPLTAASEASRRDPSFVMGAVFASVYRVLAGSPLDDGDLAADVSAARQGAIEATERDRAHVAALDLLVAGEFTAAARAWSHLDADTSPDFAALRFAHDIFLHVGDVRRRAASTAHAIESWSGMRGWGFVAGMHAFSLEEAGQLREAQRLGEIALELDADDLWARHALAHVFESADDSVAGINLLQSSLERWDSQELLANHMWWHLALRMLAAGDLDGALAVFDDRASQASTPFQLCDQTSLLWRLELQGLDGGDRWDGLADSWSDVTERHTCGFLDVHAGLVWARRPDHGGAKRWLEGLRSRRRQGTENDETFAQVVVPLVDAFVGLGQHDYAGFCQQVEVLGDTTSRLGGSIAQRDLISMTFADAATRSGAAA